MTQPDEPLAFGIIGAGIMGERMLNAVLGQAASPVRIAAIWDPDPAALARVAAAFPAVPRVAEALDVQEVVEAIFVL